MRLQFGSQEWLHILMAMRVAQKVLVQGEHYTAAYDRTIGYRIIGELMHLVKVSPNSPQIAAKIDAAMLLEALPDPAAKPVKKKRLNAAGFPVDDDDEVAAPTSWPTRPGPVVGPPVKAEPNVPFKSIDLSGVAVRAPSDVEPEATPEPEPVPESPPAPVPESAPKPDERRQEAIESAVNQALQGLTQALKDIKELRAAHDKLVKATKANRVTEIEDFSKLTRAHNDLATSTHERFLAVDEYVYAIEDKLAALKKKRGA